MDISKFENISFDQELEIENILKRYLEKIERIISGEEEYDSEITIEKFKNMSSDEAKKFFLVPIDMQVGASFYNIIASKIFILTFINIADEESDVFIGNEEFYGFFKESIEYYESLCKKDQKDPYSDILQAIDSITNIVTCKIMDQVVVPYLRQS